MKTDRICGALVLRDPGPNLALAPADREVMNIEVLLRAHWMANERLKFMVTQTSTLNLS
jgi:hypothetical protein